MERVGKLKGKTTHAGLWKCYECRKPFTVKIGTIFEDSKVAMRIWLQAMYLIAGSKKGISSNQLHRILGVTLKTAWFMSHRIREAMRSSDLSPMRKPGLRSVVRWLISRRGMLLWHFRSAAPSRCEVDFLFRQEAVSHRLP